MMPSTHPPSDHDIETVTEHFDDDQLDELASLLDDIRGSRPVRFKSFVAGNGTEVAYVQWYVAELSAWLAATEQAAEVVGVDVFALRRVVVGGWSS